MRVDVEWLKNLSPGTLSAIADDLSRARGEEENDGGDGDVRRLRLANGKTIAGPYIVKRRGLPQEHTLRQIATNSSAMEGEFVGEFGSRQHDKVPVYDDVNHTVVHVDAHDKDYYIGRNIQQKPERAYIDIYPPDDPEEIVYV